MTQLESFAQRHGVSADAVFGAGTAQVAALQNELSWYSRGWDACMGSPVQAESEAQAYAMAYDYYDRQAKRVASLGDHKQDQINGYVDAWQSLQK